VLVLAGACHWLHNPQVSVLGEQLMRLVLVTLDLAEAQQMHAFGFLPSSLPGCQITEGSL
jgi:hypothetical protein